MRTDKVEYTAHRWRCNMSLIYSQFNHYDEAPPIIFPWNKYIILEFVLVLILFLLSYYLKLLQFLGMIWCLKKDCHTINYVNKLAKKMKFLSCWEYKSVLRSSNWRNKPKNHSISQSVLSSFFPRNRRSFIIKR